MKYVTTLPNMLMGLVFMVIMLFYIPLDAIYPSMYDKYFGLNYIDRVKIGYNSLLTNWRIFLCPNKEK